MSKSQAAAKPNPAAPSEDERVERGRADLQSGRVAPHSKVKKWLRSWGKSDEQDPPLQE
jgi:predicted transcriptional regulator